MPYTAEDPDTGFLPPQGEQSVMSSGDLWPPLSAAESTPPVIYVKARTHNLVTDLAGWISAELARHTRART